MNQISLKKIAFVMPWHISERGGGAEVQANYLAQELGWRGCEVYYICQTINSEKIDKTTTNQHIKIHWLKQSGRFPWRDQRKYFAALNIIQPDIVIQRMSSNVSYVIGLYCKEKHIPYVWVCTDNISSERNLHLIRFKERINMSVNNIHKFILFYFSNFISDYFRNRGMKFVDIAFSQNKSQQDAILQNFKLYSYRMISGHPVPEKIVAAEERFKKQTVLWAANMGKHKRPELFIELARRFESSSVRFIMVGGHSNNDYITSLTQNKPNNLMLTGQLPFDEALRYFDEASIFINTSSPGGDGFPNTYIQSWLRGLPVLHFGFDPDEIIANNKLGFYANGIEEAEIHIKHLLSDPIQYKDYSERVTTYAKAHHTIEVMTNNFIKVLSDEGYPLH